MGYYINLPDMTKEQWLSKYGTKVADNFKWDQLDDGKLPVVLINNGPFTAAGIAYSPSEFQAFTDPLDNRPKIIYEVAIEDLRKVADIDHLL